MAILVINDEKKWLTCHYDFTIATLLLYQSKHCSENLMKFHGHFLSFISFSNDFYKVL